MTYSAPWLLLAVNQLLDASSARRCLGDSAGRQWPDDNELLL